jgi:hypothetical protein
MTLSEVTNIMFFIYRICYKSSFEEKNSAFVDVVADHNAFHHYSKNFKALLSCFQDKQGFFFLPKEKNSGS